MLSRLLALLAERLCGFDLSAVELLARDVAGGLAEPGRKSANRHCRLMRAIDGWVSLNLARPDDRELVPALTQGAGDDWVAVEALAASLAAVEFKERAIELQLPVSILGEGQPFALSKPCNGRFEGRVVDLSALWAGPLCTRLLADVGAEVLRVQSIGRPDPTRVVSPELHHTLSLGKRDMAIDLRTSCGLAQLHDLIASADLLVTSARPAALARLGIDPVRLSGLTWVAITAHGFQGPGAARVGFGDDCAVAGGLVQWVDEEPWFVGDALADPLSGLEAAHSVLAGERGLIEISMSGVAAAYAGMLR